MTHSSTHLLRSAAIFALAAALGLFVAACSDGGGGQPAAAPSKPKPAAESKTPEPAPTPTPTETAPAEPVDLAARGKRVYMANCIACHSQDPAIDGALGPAVAGSSRELVEARVLRAEYPEGYTPKRPSKVMITLPHLGGEIDALTAFLAKQG